MIIWSPMSKIVRAYLIEKGVGSEYQPNGDWPIATESCPNNPTNLITIFDEAARKKARTVGSGVIEDPVVTIEVRSIKPELGIYRAKLIQEAMDSLAMWVWDGSSDEYGQIITIATANRARGIFPLGADENGHRKCNLEYALVIQSIE